MNTCLECSSTELTYQISFKREELESYITTLIKQFERRNCWSRQFENTILLKEHSIPDLLDFCKDHMKLHDITYQIGNNVWHPLDDIDSTLEARWIDLIIEKESVVPYFQPIIDIEGNTFAHEVLTRAIAEDGTLIPPSDFFKVAKSRNRLYALDKLCRITAIKHAKPNQKYFVNFIPTSIYSPEHCLRTTMKAAKEAKLNPSDIVFEVVETERVDDLNHLKSILLYYKEHGFQYALDDVGEGYSTLDLLKELAPNYMKLDMKYVRGVATDKEKQEMAKRAVSVALELNIIPLAEGIEDKDDFEYLKNLGFRLFQGYLFGKPAPQC